MGGALGGGIFLFGATFTVGDADSEVLDLFFGIELRLIETGSLSKRDVS